MWYITWGQVIVSGFRLAVEPDDRSGGNELQFRFGHRQCAKVAQNKDLKCYSEAEQGR